MNKVDELKRLYEHTGSVGDETDLIKAQMEAGILNPEMVEFAAFCGHPASLAIFPKVKDRVQGGFSSWESGLIKWESRPLHFRIGLVVCDKMMPIWKELGPDEVSLEHALDLGKQYPTFLEGDDSMARFEFEEELEAAMDKVPEYNLKWQVHARTAYQAICTVLELPFMGEDLLYSLGRADTAFSYDQEVDSRSVIKKGVLRSVVPWALGR